MAPWWVEDDRWCLSQSYIVWQEGQTWCTVCDKAAPRSHIESKRHGNAVEYADQQQTNAPAPALPAPASSSDAPAPTLPAASSSADPAPNAAVLPAPASSSVDPAPALPTPAASASLSSSADSPWECLPSDAEMHFDKGYGKGKQFGYEQCTDRGYDAGHDDGYEAGKGRGYDAGHDDGYEAGKAEVLLHRGKVHRGKVQNKGARPHGDIRMRESTWQ